MNGTVHCPACNVTVSADRMWAFPHKPGCDYAAPGSILHYDSSGSRDWRPAMRLAPLVDSWDWPRWLNEYEREVAVYSHLQEQVRFTGAPVARERGRRTSWFCNVPRSTRQAAYREYAR